jgi:glycine/D-amino acid oxidase-like deaminating enzyme
VETAGGRIAAVRVAQEGGERTIRTPVFVNAAGPLARAVGRMAGSDLPLFSERHLKIAFDDHACAVPRTTGLVICEDPITLEWDEAERAELAAMDETRWLTEALPAGAHLRPEGHGSDARTVLLLWAYHAEPVAESWPVALDPDFTEVVLRGMARLVPGLRPYTRRLPKVSMDGGYYTKTRENRPLIGPLPMAGAYVVAGLSGFGLMAACAAGELLAAHVTGAPLPGYAPAFLPSRYDDPAYRAQVDAWGETGQL